MATTASRFLTFTRTEQNINVTSGFKIHVIDYKDMKSVVAIISEFQSLSWSDELSASGTGSISFDEDDPMWAAKLNNNESRYALLNREYVFEIHDRDVPRFAFLGQTVTNGMTEDETRVVTISGPGIGDVLKWAVISRPGWPTPVPITGYQPTQSLTAKPSPIYRAESSSDKIPAFNWRFPIGWPTMRMWYTVLRAAQRRGMIKFVTPKFTATTDSANKKFQDLYTLEEVVTKSGYQPETPSETLYDFLNDCTGQDNTKWFGQRLEWRMDPGFNLRVKTTIGQDRHDTVRFFQGNVLSIERTRDRSEVYNRIVAVDVNGDESNFTIADSVNKFNLREQRNEAYKNVTDIKQRTYIGSRLADQYSKEKDQWTVKIPYDSPGRVPYMNFQVGDKVGVNFDFQGWTVSNRTEPDVFRIMAITISISQDQTVPDVELTLQSKIDSLFEQYQQQITELINKPTTVKIDELNNVYIPSYGDGNQYIGIPENQKADYKLDKGTEYDYKAGENYFVREPGMMYASSKKKIAMTYSLDTQQWVPSVVSGGSSTGGGGVIVQKADPAASGTVETGTIWLETY